MKSLSFVNFYAFYTDIKNRVIALKAEISLKNRLIRQYELIFASNFAA